MPRRRVRVREHERRKPHQQQEIHVDDYNRHQEIRRGAPAGYEELGPRGVPDPCAGCGKQITGTVNHLDDGRYCDACTRKKLGRSTVHEEPGWKQRGMKLLTQADRKKLPKLYATEALRVEDKLLRVKFFTPTSNWTWYGVEFDGEDIFFGYVEGFENEWGYFSLKELSDVKGPYGVGIERDKYWRPIKFGDYIAQKS